MDKKTLQDQGTKAEVPDFYIENGLFVFTQAYHLKRGHCCKSGCRHCPYGGGKPLANEEGGKVIPSRATV